MRELGPESLRGAKAHARELAFTVRGWVAWAPGRDTEAAWQAWAGTATPSSPLSNATNSSTPPTILRRRVSSLGQAALRAAWGLPDVATARIVSASRHGEFGRTLSILQALAARDSVSPADFTLSVHHALIGLLSIATANRHGHTAIAAGRDSFGFGLVEALGCLAERPTEPVTFLFYDEPLPAPFNDFSEADEQPLVVALSLGAAGDADKFTLDIRTAESGTTGSLQALDFMRFLLTDCDVMTSSSERLQWRWRRHATAA